MGDSGSGKSSLARAILKLENNYQGKIIFLNQNINNLSKEDLTGLLHQHI